ncbi:MAG: hypothetical protein R3E54_00770 [Halioglobus sp.]
MSSLIDPRSTLSAAGPSLTAITMVDKCSALNFGHAVGNGETQGHVIAIEAFSVGLESERPIAIV